MRTVTKSNPERDFKSRLKVVKNRILLRQKPSSEKEIQFYLEIMTCDPLIFTMDHPKFIVSSQKEETLAHKGLIGGHKSACAP